MVKTLPESLHSRNKNGWLEPVGWRTSPAIAPEDVAHGYHGVCLRLKWWWPEKTDGNKDVDETMAGVGRDVNTDPGKESIDWVSEKTFCFTEFHSIIQTNQKY